jgi:putative membrane protein insertion efficiency factor
VNGINRALIAAAVICFALPAQTRAESSFAPWNAEVRCADGIHRPQPSPPRRSNYAVFGSPQAGGYALIRFFQKVISPQDGNNCRHHPVCSAYGRKAVELHGFLLGAILAGDRILRCNPYNPPSHDPVPAVITGD